ncbi:unnamed protein product [Owenia fusiformis]|nr:unnamed protein product [Owenia fusiformis]
MKSNMRGIPSGNDDIEYIFVSTIRALFPNVNWTSLFNDFGFLLEDDNYVAVQNIELFTRLSQLYNDSRRDLYNFMIWTVIQEYVWDTINYYTMIDFLQSDTHVDLNVKCLVTVNQYLHLGANALYQLHFQNYEGQQKMLNTLVEALKYAALNQIEGRSWMDEQTKTCLKERLNGLKVNFGIADISDMNEYHQKLGLNSSLSYIEQLLLVRRFALFSSVRKTSSSVRERDHRHGSPNTALLSFAPSYDPSSNSIDIPPSAIVWAGDLTRVPISALYSNLGYLIAIALAETITDDSNHQIAITKSSKCWSENTLASYMRKQECFKKHVLLDASDDEFKMLLTDLQALQIVLKAMNDANSENRKLIGLHDLINEDVVTIGSLQARCKLHRVQSMHDTQWIAPYLAGLLPQDSKFSCPSAPPFKCDL